MSMDSIQLKQEDVLKDDVVLSDINPVTNTASVDDSATGEKLQKTIEMIWNAINNKLTRVVNSVNGRTGGVVLSSEDVGLGNVDNVSFTDIKKWLIERMEQAFKDKRLYLFEDISGVDQIVDLNDDSYAWAPFFCETVDGKNGAEQKACIGLFTWDETTATLSKEYVVINTLGFDHIYDATNGEGSPSIIYDQNVEKRTGNINMSGGGIAVNIHNDEDALYIDGNGSTKRDQGLRIDKSKVSSRTFFIDGVYGYNETYRWTSSMREGYFNDQDNIFYMEYDETSDTYSDRAEGRTNTAYVDLRPYEDEETHKTLYRTYSYTTDGIWVYRSSAEADDVLHSHTWLGEQRADSFLIWQTQPTSADPECVLIIDGEEHTVRLNHEWLEEHDIRENDIIICNFMYDKYVYEYESIMSTQAILATEYRQPIIPSYMDSAFFSLNPAIGTVKSAPSVENPDKEYEIVLTSIRTNVDGGGLKYVQNHLNEIDPVLTNAKSQLNVQMISNPVEKNLSGLNGLNGYFDPVTQLKSSDLTLSGCKMFMTPNGAFSYGESYARQYSPGIAITPDDTLCTFYEKHYVPDVVKNYGQIDPTKSFYTFYDPFAKHDMFFGSYDVLNFSWPLKRGAYEKTISLEDGSQFTHALSRLSVKRNMLMSHPKDFNDAEKDQKGRFVERFINVSGLAFQQSPSEHSHSSVNNKHLNVDTDNSTDYFRRFGMNDHLDAYGKSVEDCYFYDESGGLYVNVGRFLEIAPKRHESAKDFDESGKINVRIGKGLTEKAEYVDVPFDTDTGLYELSESEFARYYNEFAKLELATGEIIPFRAKWKPLTEQPTDWETAWWNYGFCPSTTEMLEISSNTEDMETALEYLVFRVPKTYPPDFSTISPEYFRNISAAGEEPVYEKLTEKPSDWYINCEDYYAKLPSSVDGYIQVTPQVPTFVPQDPAIPDAYKPIISPFYERVGMDQTDTEVAIVTVAEMSSSIIREQYRLVRLQKSNRISVDVDEETLVFDQNGKLRVSDAVGGTNIRISDTRGCYYDTMGSSSVEKPIDDFLNLGPGLKIIGGNPPTDYLNNRDTLRSYIIDSIGDQSGTQLTVADLVGIFIATKVPSATPIDPVSIAGVGPMGAGAIYNNLVHDTSYTLPMVKGLYATYIAGLEESKRICMNSTRRYLLANEKQLDDRMQSILDSAKYKSTYFDLFTAVKEHYSLSISFAETDTPSSIRAKFNSSFNKGTTILDISGSVQYPLDWLFNDFVALVAAAPDEIEPEPEPEPEPSEYYLLSEEPDDWATNFADYYVSDGANPPVYTHVEGVAPNFGDGTYYDIPEDLDPSQITPLETEPEDWATNYGNYYMYNAATRSYIPVAAVAPVFATDTYYTTEDPNTEPQTDDQSEQSQEEES